MRKDWDNLAVPIILLECRSIKKNNFYDQQDF
jgi:hypothetical protein